MSKKRIRITALVFAFLFVFSFAQIALAKDLLFPMRYKPLLTSSFGEYRIGHPHAGLDFSTGLQNGRHVVAADDGNIIQIRVSYTGYGLALYQRTTEGKILVYAHLNGFASKIRKIVKKIQQQNGRYSFSRYFSPGEIPVKRGEFIAYSGDTGTDIPHLHFEVRNANNVTVNPLTNGIRLTDTTSPVIQRLHVEPLAFDAHVDNGWHDQTYSFKKNPDGSYYLDEPVKIGGKAGFSVQCTDYIDGSPRLLNPYTIEFQVDNNRKYFLRFDKFDYNMGAISELDYDYRLREQRRGTFHRLYRMHERLVFDPDNLTGDLSDLTPGNYNATIICGDANGNRSRAHFQMQINAKPRIESVKFENKGAELSIRVVAMDPDGQVTRVSVAKQVGKDWVEIPAPAEGKGVYTASLSGSIETTTFKVTASDDSGSASVPYTTTYNPNAPVEPTGEINAKSSFTLRDRTVSLLLLRSAGFTHSPDIEIILDPPAPKGAPKPEIVRYQEETAIRINADIPKGWRGGTYTVRCIFKDNQGTPYFGQWSLPLQVALKKGTILASADGKAQLVVPVGGTYGDVPLTVSKVNLKTPSWLEPITDGYKFSQTWEPMRKKLRASIEVPDGLANLQQVGLYLYDRGVWWYLGKSRERGRMAARVSHMGTFALMRDNMPPDIGDITPAGVVANLKPEIKVPVKDSGAGLYGGGIDFRLDGVKKIVQWHPIHGYLRYKSDEKLSVGTHKVIVTLTDRAGNTATRSGNFTISR